MAKKRPTRQTQHDQAEQRRERILDLIVRGMLRDQACAEVGVHPSTYKKWRQRYPKWGAAIDVARANSGPRNVAPEKLTSAEFAFKYFGHLRTPFQQLWIDKVQRLRPGNILLALWPPEYGKTATFEDYASEMLARDPTWCSTVVSEAEEISKKIVGKCRTRCEPYGPSQQYVADWGPFKALTGRSADASQHQPWTTKYFSVAKRQMVDERDYSMLAIPWKGSTVSIRTAHLHIDDIQSTKTLKFTKEQINWFRQDGLSRPGETGITSISMTRVGDGDFPEQLLDDDELEGILEVVRFPAIWYDEQGVAHPLWPEKHDLEALDRIRRKIKDAAFDRNYMMAPGQSKTKRTFSEEGWGRAVLPSRRLNVMDRVEQWVPGSAMKPPMILSLDPALNPGKCSIQAWAADTEWMRLRYGWESDQMDRNEEIIDQLRIACRLLSPHYRITHLVVEANNFQQGLAKDERLAELARAYSFIVRGHKTNINKYDETIGLASMAGDWEAGKIQLPYADDQVTRNYMDELHRQAKAWKPYQKGTALRQDRIMAMWFAWICWQETKHLLGVKREPIRRPGLPYAPTVAAPIIPVGARL